MASPIGGRSYILVVPPVHAPPLTPVTRATQMTFGRVTLLVREYDEAIDFYVEKLGFFVLEDVDVGNGKRWIVLGPSGGGLGLILVRVTNDEDKVGFQVGNRVFGVLYTSDIAAKYTALRTRNVVIVHEPVEHPNGKILVFRDLYGNMWDLIEPPAAMEI
jgi:catechol 2,3-dioxygenase-like lactoylglutathione lyase family enzyme